MNSRQVTKNNLFLTIKGKNNDGVKFAGKALKSCKIYCFVKKYKKF